MSILDLFNDQATSAGSYIKFDDLAIGSYSIKSFALMKKSTYGGKRLLVHLESGYLILPERMNKFAIQAEIDRLNSGSYNFVYLGKQAFPQKNKTKGNHSKINFRLEINNAQDKEEMKSTETEDEKTLEEDNGDEEAPEEAPEEESEGESEGEDESPKKKTKMSL